MTSVHGDTRRETRFLKVFANYTMLTPPQHAAHLLMSKISVGRDPKNPTTSFNGQNPTLNGRIPNSRINGPISTDSFSKTSNSQDHLFRAWCHPPSTPISCLGFIMTWCSRYRRRKWTRRYEFKSWTRLIAFHIALIPLGKVWIQLFSLQLWVNSRTD